MKLPYLWSCLKQQFQECLDGSYLRRLRLLFSAKPEAIPGSTCIVSVDASIKKNPGGPASVGVVLDMPGTANPHQSIGRCVPANTNNEAEYDAVYEALGQLSSLIMACLRFEKIEIHSDSQLVVKQLSGEYKSSIPRLTKRRDLILEKLEEMREIPGFPTIEIKWYPRNSTLGLKLANDTAQDMIDVPNH